MAVGALRPDMDATEERSADACTYCGADVTAHDPLALTDLAGDRRLGQFCNYACLQAHIEAEDLTTGDACVWDPDG
jgi:hypothetical protein